MGHFPHRRRTRGTPVTRARHPIVMVGLCALMVGEAVWSMRNDLIPTLAHHAVVVLSAVVMVLVGELVRVHMPSGRVLAPISSAVGFTLASLGAVQGSASFAVRPGVVILCYATGQVLAAALRREVDTTGGAAARLLSVGILVHLIRGVDVAGRTLWEWQLVSSTPRWVVAAALVCGASTALVIERLLTAMHRAHTLRTSTATALRDEFEEAPTVTFAGAAPGPIATLIAPVAGVLALPLALIPLVITMISVRRYAEVWRTLRQTIQTLSRLTEAGGYTPPDHAHRTAQLGRAMAQRMGLGEREVTALEYAALLHDLGQVVLADPIPGGATVLAAPADQRMIASTGATIIRHGPDFAAVADLVEAQAVQYRSILEHEARAPLASRILRVANAFDDLTGGIQEPATVSRALERIHLGLGYDYDPEIVAVLEATVAHGPIPLPDGGPRGLGASRRSTD